jgi:hypothetical protein
MLCRSEREKDRFHQEGSGRVVDVDTLSKLFGEHVSFAAASIRLVVDTDVQFSDAVQS